MYKYFLNFRIFRGILNNQNTEILKLNFSQTIILLLELALSLI